MTEANIFSSLHQFQRELEEQYHCISYIFRKVYIIKTIRMFDFIQEWNSF